MSYSKIIYLVGVVGFGLGYYMLKGTIDNDLVLIGVAATYLFFVKWVAKQFDS